MYFLITMSDIQDCSDNGIVACWSDEFNGPIVEVNNITSQLFSDRQKVG